MRIELTNIEFNPHRDIKIYPINREQITRLKQSIAKTGFWENISVRKHPTKKGKYQLTSGHHRLIAALESGITKVDIPVRELTDDLMLHIMIDENATQAGGNSPESVEDSVKAMVAFLSHCILTSNYKAPSTIVEGLFENEHSFLKAKGVLLSGEGIGENVLHKFNSTITLKALRIALESLKKTGIIRELLETTQTTITKEEAEIERKELALYEQEKLEQEEANKIKETLIEQAKEKNKIKKENESKLAKLTKEEDIANELLKQKQSNKDHQSITNSAITSLGNSTRKQKKTLKALEEIEEKKEVLNEVTEQLQEALDTPFTPTIGKNISKYFDNATQVSTFISSLEKPQAVRFISIDQHENIAKAIRESIDKSAALTEQWIKDNKSIAKKERKNPPIRITLSASYIESYINSITDEALGSQRSVNNAKKREEEKSTLKRLENSVKKLEETILLINGTINSIRSLLKRNPEIAESISITRTKSLLAITRKECDKFETTISELEQDII